MKSEQEIRDNLIAHRKWMDEWEGSGVAEEGVELGWIEALTWALGEQP